MDDGLLATLKLLHIIDTAEHFELKGQAIATPLATLWIGCQENLPAKSCGWDVPTKRNLKWWRPCGGKRKNNFRTQFSPVLPITETDNVKTQPPQSGLIEVDGVRVQFRDGSFFLVRASNTSPMLTFRFEGATEQTLDARFNDALSLLQPFREWIKKLDQLKTASGH